MQETHSFQLAIALGSIIHNKPLLIHRGSLAVVQYVYEKLIHEGMLPQNCQMPLFSISGKFGPTGRNQKNVFIIPVAGVLHHRGNIILDYLLGNSSYEGIRTLLQIALNDSDTTSIIFDINSPGGEAHGLFDLVDDIYNARGIKPIYAVINETAFSAAYAIASSAGKIFIPRTGKCGSIGVIMEHCDQSKFDEKQGVKYTPIFAGKHKNDFNPHAPLSINAFRAGRESVDSIYDLFVKTISRNRSISTQAVLDTEAAIFYGEKAIRAGLASQIDTWEKVIPRLSK